MCLFLVVGLVTFTRSVWMSALVMHIRVFTVTLLRLRQILLSVYCYHLCFVIEFTFIHFCHKGSAKWNNRTLLQVPGNHVSQQLKYLRYLARIDVQHACCRDLPVVI